VAVKEGAVAGIAMAARWGSVGVFGPLAVDPRFWNYGVAGKLLEVALENPTMRDARLQVLSTAAGSVANIRLYQRFEFWPGFLIPILTKGVDGAADPNEAAGEYYSQLREEQKSEVLKECAVLTDTAYEGLEVSHEIRSVDRQGLGETLLLWDHDRLDGFATCHCGSGTEAGEGTCYLKFGTARSPNAFDRVLGAAEVLARTRGLERLTAGVNSGRRTVYRQLLVRGFRAEAHAVAMQRGTGRSYDTKDVLIVDDWR